MHPMVTQFRAKQPTRAGRFSYLWPNEFAEELATALSAEAKTRVDVTPDPEAESEHHLLFVTMSPHEVNASPGLRQSAH